MTRLAPACGLVALLIGACAGAPGPAKEAAAGAPAAPAVEYERILGAFAVDADILFMLDPELCARHCREADARDELAALAVALGRAGHARGQAVAWLNHGALSWSAWLADEAYQSVMRARELFARAGDSAGLARCEEWLGFMLQGSDQVALAAEHFGLAYKLNEALGDQAAAQRVLRYARE